MILMGIAYHKDKRYAMGHMLDWLELQSPKQLRPIMRWHLGPYGEPLAIKENYEFFRKLAVAQNADLCLLEVDTIPPPDGLQRLIDRQKDVVGGLYYYRDPEAPAVAWVHNDPKRKFLESEESLVPVDGMGTGFVLLSNKAINSFSFMDWPGTDADYPMYDRLRAKGFEVWLDKSVVCKHYATEQEYH